MFLNLLFEIKKAGLTQKKFAQIVGISGIYRKMHSITDWKYLEIKKIVEFFNLKLSADYLFQDYQIQKY